MFVRLLDRTPEALERERQATAGLALVILVAAFVLAGAIALGLAVLPHALP
jgi:hypothetical protein